ncbi:MAG: flavin reductase family protein [Lachnospiraceae bacterium]|nr:flavin reductase family protein [Lachnospiraceae bacterium]
MKRENFKPGNMLYPLPAVMVSCKKPGERPNIVTIAWAGTVCSNPPMVSISVRPERYSYAIIKETGEFVINLTTRDLAAAMDTCGVVSGRDVDKFEKLHLTEIPVDGVDAPGIGESPVCIACKVRDVISLGSHDMFLADVVNVSVDASYLDENGRFDLNRADLLTYSHGTYFGLGEQLGTFGYSVRKKKKPGTKKREKREKLQS